MTPVPNILCPGWSSDQGTYLAPAGIHVSPYWLKTGPSTRGNLVECKPVYALYPDVRVLALLPWEQQCFF